MTGAESSGSADVLVLGGGIAGLVTAWELARAGRRPHLVEGSPTVGGCVARHTVGGLDLDSGAESYATATPAVANLLADLGLTAAVVTPNPVGAWVRHARGYAPLPKATLLGMPSHPLAADVRRVLGVAGSARAGLDLLLPARFGAVDSASLGALVSRRMGRSVVTRLVEPVAGGVYSADPDELDVDAIQPRLRSALARTGSLASAVRQLRGSDTKPGSAVGGLAGGMFTLVDALAQDITEHGGTISTGRPVTRVTAVPGGWQVVGGTQVTRTASLVVAVSGAAAVALLSGAGVQSPIAAAQTSDVLLVTLVLQQASLDLHPRGTGVLVSRNASGVTAKALTHATAKWSWLSERAGPGRHVLRLSYGRGDRHLPEAEALPAVALADAATLMGVALPAASVLDSAVVRWSSALPRPQPGHRAATELLRKAVAGRPGLYLTGSMVAGTGLAAVVADARAVAARVVADRSPSSAAGGSESSLHHP